MKIFDGFRITGISTSLFGISWEYLDKTKNETNDNIKILKELYVLRSINVRTIFQISSFSCER